MYSNKYKYACSNALVQCHSFSALENVAVCAEKTVRQLSVNKYVMIDVMHGPENMHIYYILHIVYRTAVLHAPSLGN